MLLALAARLAIAADWAPGCDTEWAYRWYRPDQRRDSLLDEPERHPRLPHTRGPDAGRQRGYPPRCDEDRRKRELAQWLSPADDPIGYRGVCVLHHSGPPCRGDPTPLPRWVPDSPEEPWTQNVFDIPGSWRR